MLLLKVEPTAMLMKPLRQSRCHLCALQVSHHTQQLSRVVMRDTTTCNGCCTAADSSGVLELRA